ncbi:hypothetical protein DYI24_00020 [Rhodopseudomonas sp. BR0C11]|uniref:phage tail tube protein n=1 Tax=Rhodopseudomonas sp. BR0C11 TaxID=2269370 RepID=UPI0013E0C560|nr:phage tail tube protein [Rhodopseudomonas sp. BR0C11]NEV75466.1 hypothetical protein [Rhodopseudomonas sp. BR0C11]
MTSSNRMYLALVREGTPGTPPDTPRMRKMRITGESLSFSPTYVDSEEMRDDRMLGDPIKTMQSSGGGINFELSYPEDNSPLSELIRSTMFNPWVNTPTFENDGAADSVITDAGTTLDTFAVVGGGAAVKLGHLVRATGFGQSANNQIFRAASATDTTIVGSGLNLVAEAAPAGTAKLKVVGFQGAAGDITALADGLGSTALDFTTLGLTVGRWLKIGGSADASQFAFLVSAGAKKRKAAWGRVVSVTANKITLDNLPSNWTADAGTGKTIKVWFGDWIANGVSPTSVTIERGFMGQATPSYIWNYGMVVNTMSLDINSGDKIKGSFNMMGLGGGADTTPLDASPDPVTTNLVMAANANVGRLGVAGAQLVGPNWAKSLSFQIDNNLRALDAVDDDAPVAINDGECKVTGKLETYFGSLAELQSFYAGTPRQINGRVDKAGQAVVFQAPRAIYRGDGNPSASAKNTDVMLPLSWQSSHDPATNAHFMIDRLPYFEA